MRVFRLILIVTLFALPSTNLWAQSANEISIDQLKEQIQKLSAIERDATAPSEVKSVNRIFLKQRRVLLQSLLQKNVDGLRGYLERLGPALSPEEKLIVQNTIKQAELDLKTLNEEIAGLVENKSAGAATDSPTNTNGTAVVSPPVPSIALMSPTNSPAAPVTVGAASISAPDVQPQAGLSLNDQINARIQLKAENRVEQTDNTKQTDVPSISETSGSLVDQSSASDLIGLATNFAGLSASTNGDQPDPSSVSVTTSAYSLLAAIQRVDPLNTIFYNEHRNWRKLSFTLGYDDEDLLDGTKQRAKIFGAKFLFFNKRDPGLKRNHDYIAQVGQSLQDATVVFGKLSTRVRAFVINLDSVRTNLFIPGFKAFLEKRRTQILQDKNLTVSDRDETIARIDILLKNPGDEKLFVLGKNFLPTDTWTDEETLYETEFLNEYLGPDYRKKLGDDVANAVDEFIDQQLTDAELVAFRNLNDDARKAVEAIRRAPQFSLAFTTKQRRIGIDEYLATLIFDYGVADRINLTLNGAYSYNDSDIVGGDLRGFKFGGQLRFQLNRENLLGKKPLFFDVATQGSWMNNTDAIYKAQGKLTIPIADGIDFPISVTYANRTNLIDEKEVRGQFGFSLDTARLMRMFLFR
jgi:hypothetical protein